MSGGCLSSLARAVPVISVLCLRRAPPDRRTPVWHSTETVQGVYTLATTDIFQRIQREQDKEFKVRVSFLEIYNEKIKDLLASASMTRALELQEDPVKGMVVQDLQEFEVMSVKQVEEIIAVGNSRRTQAATGRDSVPHAHPLTKRRVLMVVCGPDRVQ